MNNLETNDLLEAIALAYADIEALLDESEDAQWQQAPYASSRDEARIRGKGTVTDPTSSIALDGRRLRLRAAVVQAERELAETLKRLHQTHDRLEKSLDRWAGDFK